jgi:hypothetical protein
MGWTQTAADKTIFSPSIEALNISPEDHLAITCVSHALPLPRNLIRRGTYFFHIPSFVFMEIM